VVLRFSAGEVFGRDKASGYANTTSDHKVIE
jgi:hypothetical protein